MKTKSNNEYYYITKIKDLTDEIKFYRGMIAKLRRDKKDLEMQLDMHEFPYDEDVPYDY